MCKFDLLNTGQCKQHNMAKQKVFVVIKNMVPTHPITQDMH